MDVFVYLTMAVITEWLIDLFCYIIYKNKNLSC